ncbi:ABC transporter ATP-binding protein [Fangia hongkongensis]|uniref:ABC transporter ATP-binding protein n=1 Tax=Fangia hongkongensis TaxID=270495 RepID=UPI000364EDBB|nr:ATP-binding cassette domain-containing protein [Fangia hongkongensis]MBK2123688.1 ATP-binding cassette domain-containing protein [Fangia hongkongensis]
MSDYVLSCEHVFKSYQDGKSTIQVLDNVSFHLNQGEKVAILGLSGSGKTTLLNLLGGLDKLDKGEIYLNAKRFDHLSANKRALMRNRHLGFVYQFHHLLPEFNALDNVLMPLMMRPKTTKRDNTILAKEMLDAVGLSHRFYHKPAALSGGERQRVAIARALVTKPSCVLADEPTGNLDSHNSEKILELIEKLSQEFSVSFIVVTHDKQLAAKMDKIYVIENAKLAVL